MRMGGVATRQVMSDLAVREEADILRETARASAARRDVTWPRRPLTPLVQALLWSLRLYVILMAAVIVVQLTRLGG